jgi:hypothetical protein
MKHFVLKKKDWLSTSVFRIALVENPAIETDFVYLNKEGKPLLFSVQEEKRMIYSPVLIPDQKIPRMSESGEAYTISLEKETIEEIARDYMLKKTTLGEWNYEHDEKQKLTGVDVVENWIVQDPANDKATLLGFKVPAGTWMQGTYITNDQVLSDIKSKKVKGVSVEMDMAHELINLSIKNSEMSETNKKLDQKLDQILVKLGMRPSGKTKLASIEVGEGMAIYADVFEQGERVYTDEAMTIDAVGVFENEGKVMTVEGGILVSITDKEEEVLDEATFDHEGMKKEIEGMQAVAKLQVEAAVEMSKDNVSLKAELNKAVELLTKVAAQAELSTEKLAKIQTSIPASITRLSQDEKPSAYINLINQSKRN